MNEIEVVELPNGIEGILAEIKPSTPIKWNSDTGVYEKDTDEKVLDRYKNGCELLKDSLRGIYSFGEKVARGTPKFCLDLKRIYENLRYVEDKNANKYGYQVTLNVCPDMSDYGRSGSNFIKLVSRLGISETAAYRYKDLAVFVNEETEDLYDDFKGYSISLLSEIWAYAKESYNYYLNDLKKLSKVISADTSVDDIRLYRKVMRLWSSWKAPFEKSKDRDKIKRDIALSEVLKVYNKLLQQQENDKLNSVLDTSKTPEKKPVVTLVDSPEIQALRKENEELKIKVKRAEKVGACDGCKFKEKNLNKCRCCCRYESLKDLFANE